MLVQRKSSAADIERSYRVCREEARRAASSFCWSFNLLPRDQRRAMHALYAFSRRTDDLADGFEAEIHSKQTALDAWRTATRSAFDGDVSGDPILLAVADAAVTFAIDEQLLFELIDGVEMDLTERRYRTWSDLQEYCYKVASVVGLACIKIWGAQCASARAPAISCGYALQLTNILRDLKEDAARDRVYLPLDDLERFDYSPDDLQSGVADDRFIALMRFEIERAKSLYGEADLLAPELPPSPRRVFRLMTGAYRELLASIERKPDEVLKGRMRIGWRGKTKAICRALI